MWFVIKLLNCFMFTKLYVLGHIPLHCTYILSRGVALYFTCIASSLSLWCLWTLFTLSYYFHRTILNNYTSGQLVSFMLLWQLSDCIDLFVIDYFFVLFSKNKYDDDSSRLGVFAWPVVHRTMGSLFLAYIFLPLILLFALLLGLEIWFWDHT